MNPLRMLDDDGTTSGVKVGGWVVVGGATLHATCWRSNGRSGRREHLALKNCN